MSGESEAESKLSIQIIIFTHRSYVGEGEQGKKVKIHNFSSNSLVGAENCPFSRSFLSFCFNEFGIPFEGILEGSLTNEWREIYAEHLKCLLEAHEEKSEMEKRIKGKLILN